MPPARAVAASAESAPQGGPVSSQWLTLPGRDRPELVRYQVVGGTAMMEGDIQLGPVASLSRRYVAPAFTHKQGAIASAPASHLWPNGVIPFEIDASVPPDQVANIHKAIAMVNPTELEVRPRTPADADYMVFSTAKGGCSSYMGRIGGPQDVQVGICGPGSIAHEILHAAGFNHEQTRSDRDVFVTILWDEIEPQFRFAFEQRGGKDIGAYDYASVMHYGPRAFSRTGKPTIIPRMANAPIGQREALSAGDRAAITALYAGGGLPGGWGLPLPSLPGLPVPAPAGACPAGQVKDQLFLTCAPACASGSSPMAGVCAPAGSTGPVPQSCATPADLLSGKCLPQAL